MRLFLILLPFAALSALLALASPMTAAFGAAAIASVSIAIDILGGRSLKLLHAATVALLLAIGIYALAVDPHVSGNATRVLLDAGLLAVVAIALACGFPFTAQYARETVDPDVGARPDFHRTNRVLTGVWIAALALMLVADIGAIYLPWLPLWTGVAAAFVARNGAAWFTTRYTAHRLRMAEGARLPTSLPTGGDLA